MEHSPKLVSVIVTTKNESGVLARLLKSIQAQSYGKIELIVVDNASSDSTVEIAGKFSRNVYQKGPERSAQRNYGASKSHGEYLIFLDADMDLAPQVISECVSAVHDTKVGGVIIPEHSVGSSFWARVKAFERSFYEDKMNYWIESARFFPRKIFLKSTGYDETITGPEDWDLSESVRKHGYKLVKISAYITHHERTSTLSKIAQKWYYYGLKSHRSLSKQKSGIVNPKTIHFLRAEFYQQWRKLVSHPILSIAMITMLSVQLIAGGTGFIVGKIRNY